MRKGTGLLIAIAILFTACGDKTVINNYYGSETATVTGTVYPADDVIAVIIESEGINVAVDENGLFTIRDLAPGTYDIVIQPTNYSKRKIFDVLLMAGQVYNLGKFEISTLPYPVYQFRPSAEDLERDPSYYTNVTLYTDEPLNLDDLNTQVTINPPLAGTWNQALARDGGLRAMYHYAPEEREPPVGMTYEFVIPASLRTAAGAELGESVVIALAARTLAVSVNVPRYGLNQTVAIQNFRVQLSFNTEADLDSLKKGVSFVPAIEGAWLAQEVGSSRYFNFFVVSGTPLLADTEYRMVISDQVALAGAARLRFPDTTYFTTEPYGVTSVNPRNGSIYVSSGVPVSLSFNAAMDNESVEAAFSLTTSEGEPVSGTFNWVPVVPSIFTFIPDAPLTSGTVYRIHLTTDAMTGDGEHLSYEFESFFGVG